jgi:hypothetical protein
MDPAAPIVFRYAGSWNSLFAERARGRQSASSIVRTGQTSNQGASMPRDLEGITVVSIEQAVAAPYASPRASPMPGRG